VPNGRSTRLPHRCDAGATFIDYIDKRNLGIENTRAPQQKIRRRVVP
jgi:hypothetical protein